MKIYTKTGDQGETGLFGGKRVGKDDLRVDAYGNVDELNAFIGLLSDALHEHPTVHGLLLEVQRRLFSVGAHLATDPDGDFAMPIDLHNADVAALETAIDEMERVLPPLSNFILPGGHPTVSMCHVCRTVCRRAERSVVALSRLAELDPLVLHYLNRLSDYFFVLGRWAGLQLGVSDVIWSKR
jgi:cob(I)alamin adenosyltransferase